MYKEAGSQVTSCLHRLAISCTKIPTPHETIHKENAAVYSRARLTCHPSAEIVGTNIYITACFCKVIPQLSCKSAEIIK